MFKGVIDAGSSVRASFSLAPHSDGTALLTMVYGPFDGEGVARSRPVAPAGTNQIDLRVDEEGMLRIVVDVSASSDTGSLTVLVDEVVRDDQPPIRGDTTWLYSVENPA